MRTEYSKEYESRPEVKEMRKAYREVNKESKKNILKEI